MDYISQLDHGQRVAFEAAMSFLIEHEGGTNDDPEDRGGLTKYGISQKTYPYIDIEALTLSGAYTIYEKDYWIRNSCHKVYNKLAIVLFDSSVNCGCSSAGKWLQQSVNDHNMVRDNPGELLAVDGIVGEKTVRAVNRFDHNTMMQRLFSYRLRRYTSLIKRYPEQLKFIRGWTIRVCNLMDYTASPATHLYVRRIPLK